jgi:putative ABC transport system permease protein
MLTSYVTLAFRHLARNRFYAMLNIVGLSIGLSCLIVSILFVDYHTQFNAGHERMDRLYRVIRHVDDASGKRYDVRTHPVAPHLAAELPEVEEATRVLNRPMWVTHGEKGFNEKVAVVDSSFTRMFTVPMVAGDANTGLLEQGSCFVTETLAGMMFPGEEAVGRIIHISYKWLEGDYTVTGVMKDSPEKAYPLLRYDVLTATFGLKEGTGWREHAWAGWPSQVNTTPLSTYLLLREDVDQRAFSEGLQAFSERHYHLELERRVDYHVQRLDEAHLYTMRDYGISEGADVGHVMAILGVGVLVLLLACLNYVNLVTAQSPVRAREVGLRKMSGALRRNLIFQFLGESLLMVLMSFLIAVALTTHLLPTINVLLDFQLQMSEASRTVLIILPLVAIPLIGLVAGFYPAFVLSRYAPARSVRGDSGKGGSPSWLRTALVVFQFSASGALIVGTLIVHQQLEYSLNKDLGFETDRIVMMPMFLRTSDRNAMYKQLDTIRNEMRAVPGVSHVTGISLRPGYVSTVDFRDVSVEGSADVFRLSRMGTDEEFFNTFGVTVVAGEVPNPSDRFRRISETEAERAVMINARAGRMLGLGEDAVGKRFYQEFDSGAGRIRMWYLVTGVVDDYHNQSLRSEIAPMVLEIPGPIKYVAAKLAPGHQVDTMRGLEAVWSKFLPGKPFEFDFVDDVVRKRYSFESQLREILVFFSTLSILVGCLGVLGLVTYTAKLRTKEIGVRKVLGASNGGILALLSIGFLKLTLVSFAIAWPLAYLAGNDWLDGFVYRIDLGPMPFVASALVTLGLLAITVGIQSWRSATADPVTSLRQE